MSKGQRILVYGFGPYRQFRVNITQKILRRLERRHGLQKIVFAVRFHRSQFIEAIKKHHPDIILGLGQCSRGRQLRIEARAVNARRNRKEAPVKKIVAKGAAALATDLRLFLGQGARGSRFAGDYVCNYSMYVMLDFIKRQGASIRYGFIHIPHDYDPHKAVALLNRAIARSIARN